MGTNIVNVFLGELSGLGTGFRRECLSPRWASSRDRLGLRLSTHRVFFCLVDEEVHLILAGDEAPLGTSRPDSSGRERSVGRG